MVWLVLSIAAVELMYWLIRRSPATGVASLFYLVPVDRRRGARESRSPLSSNMAEPGEFVEIWVNLPACRSIAS
jgi:hypothetical protein